MFCVKCGAENPDDAEFCCKCGKPAFRPQSTSGFQTPAPPVSTNPISSPSTRKPCGIGGWLAFLCVSFTVISPLVWFVETVSFFQKDHVVLGFMALGMGVFSLSTGIYLWRKDPSAIKWAKEYLLVNIVVSVIISFAGTSGALDDPHVLGFAIGQAIGVFVAGSIVTAIWWLYLNKSVRVKNTYGEVEVTSNLGTVPTPTSQSQRPLTAGEADKIQTTQRNKVPDRHSVVEPRTEGNTTRILLFALAAVVCLTLGLTVWPTLYRYDQIHRDPGTSHLVRINRFTGQAEILSSHGWKPLAAEPPQPPAPVDEADPFAKYLRKPASPGPDEPGGRIFGPASPAPNQPLVRSVGRAAPIPPPTGLENLEITHFGLPCPTKGTDTYGFGAHVVADGSCAEVSASVHNGSERTLRSIMVEITVPAKKIVGRRYRLACDENGRSRGQGIDSYHSGDCWVDLGRDLINEDDAITFKPVSADLSAN
jgi:hypothetical protein